LRILSKRLAANQGEKVPPYKDLDKLTLFTSIEGILVNETPLRVGTGQEAPLESSVDMAVYKVGENPCIPGSSLKGVIRSTVEMILRSQYKQTHPPWELPESEKNGDFCAVCGIFGNQELAAHLRIYDAYPIDEAPLFIKPGVAIDRDFGSVAQGPFFEEFVVPGTKWKFKADIINIKVFPERNQADERARLLYELFEILKNKGLQVGARKSVGAGLVVLKEGKWETFELKDGSLTNTGTGEL
jgi:CRISPR/Cas system CSM-associated protein Csm3 (group 7 of RAMP superfamily)